MPSRSRCRLARTPTLLLLLALLQFAFSCGDHRAEAIATYHAAMDAQMIENAQVASRFLVLARSISKDKADTDVVARQIESDVVAQSDRLKDAIAAIKTDLPELKEIHEQAVSAWTLQAKGYHDVVSAYKGNDLDAFAQAQKEIGQAKVMAETYIKEVNGFLEPYGYHLDEFPQGR
jgi:hypothetical protein